MKKEELRVGNLVYAFAIIGNIPNPPHTYRISFIDIGRADDFEPIPLTEEWLLKFGFTNGKKTGHLIVLGVRQLQTATQGEIDGEWRVDIIDSVPTLLQKSIKYVHELQNLYFALCGEELQDVSRRGSSLSPD